MDGRDTLQNANAEKRGNRDGAACAGLQYDPRHEPHGHSGDDRSDEGVNPIVRLQITQKRKDEPRIALTDPTIHQGSWNNDTAPNAHERQDISQAPRSNEFPHSLSAQRTPVRTVAKVRFPPKVMDAVIVTEVRCGLLAVI